MARNVTYLVTKKSNFTVLFGIFLVSMLFVPPSMPFVVPEAEAQNNSTGDGSDTDTTPPVVTFYADHFPDNSLEFLQQPKIATNSTGQNVAYRAAGTPYDPGWPMYHSTGGGQCNENSSVYCIIAGELHYREHNMSCSPVSGFLFPVGTTTVTCTATDAAGTTGTASFTVTVVLEESSDTTPPVVTFYAPREAGDGSGHYSPADSLEFLQQPKIATNSTGQNVAYYAQGTPYADWPDTMFHSSALGSDYESCSQVDGTGCEKVGEYYYREVNMSCSPHSGFLFPVGTTTVTCTATDAAGTTGTASFPVTVVLEESSDTTPPVVTLPSNQTFSTSNSTGVMYYYDPIATDDVGFVNGATYNGVAAEYSWRDGVFTCTRSDGVTTFLTYSVPSPYPIGTTTTTCTAVDAAGNPGTASFTVTVNYTGSGDTTPPTMIASAYLNSTSSTGRTLNVITENLNSAGQTIHYTITKDGTAPAPNGAFGQYGHFDLQFNFASMAQRSTPLQVEIPVNWLTGTYDISWNTYCSGIAGVCFTGSSSFTIPALPETEAAEIVIPSWIKNNAGWWASGQISDDSFVAGLQWLITNEIMHIPPTEQGAGSDSVIPGWIKNNAEWWADDLIDDRNFVTGLQWLITNGIMVIG